MNGVDRVDRVDRVDTTSRRASVWFAVLAGPLAWTAHELLSYVLVKVACGSGLGVTEHLVTLGALALAGAGTYVGVRLHAGGVRPPRSTLEFLAAVAIVIDLLFVLAIVMEAIPDAVVDPCL